MHHYQVVLISQMKKQFNIKESTGIINYGIYKTMVFMYGIYGIYKFMVFRK